MQKGFILFVPKLALKNISLVLILKKGEICKAFRPMGGNRQQNEEVDSGGTIYNLPRSRKGRISGNFGSDSGKQLDIW